MVYCDFTRKYDVMESEDLEETDLKGIRTNHFIVRTFYKYRVIFTNFTHF